MGVVANNWNITLSIIHVHVLMRGGAMGVVTNNYLIYIHDVFRDVERKKERKKERKTPEAMEK